jgi:hypothetical protein
MIQQLDALTKYLQEKFIEKVKLASRKKCASPIPHYSIPVMILVECERVVRMLHKAISNQCK